MRLTHQKLLKNNTSNLTLSQSILQCKCPRCRKGELFTASNHYNLTKMLSMPKQCAVCGQLFEIEPGFFLAALWISYPLVLAVEIAVLVTCYLVLNYSLLISFLFAAAFLLVLLPPVMRYSRSILIHLFISFDKARGS